MQPKDIERTLREMSSIPQVYSESVYSVVSSILRTRSVKRMFDIAAIPQSFIFRAADEFGPDIAVANPVDLNYGDNDLFDYAIHPLIKHAQPNHCVDTMVTWIRLRPYLKKEKWDIIFGVLSSLQELERALEYVDPDGIGIFHVHTFFFQNVSRLGPLGSSPRFYIQAALEIPSGLLGSFFFEEFADEYLIIVDRHPQDNLFVASVTDDNARNKEVLSNLAARREGRVLRYGLLTSVQYPAFDEWRYWVEANSTKDRLEYSHRASEVVQSIEFMTNELESESEPNSMILGLPDSDVLGVGNVRVILDSNRILADYLSFYIDESLKHRRELVRKREDIEKGRFGALVRYKDWLDRCNSQVEIVHRILNTRILLPDLETQREIVRVAMKFGNISTHVDILRSHMWTKPEALQAIEMELAALGQADKLRVWTDTLPFPHASILWAYEATTDIRNKIEHLLDFFEALAQFGATVMLSAAKSNQEFYASNCHHWIDKDPARRNTFLHASMGNWVHLSSKLARFMRKQLDSPTDEGVILKMFGGSTRTSVDALCNGKFWALLREALGFRNEWKGHSGRASEDELENRLNVLVNLSTRVKWALSDKLKSMRFVVRKEETDFKEGIHTYRVRVLVGSTTPLPEDIIRTEVPMESNEIYLIGRDQKTPVKLLPLIKLIMREKTETPLCYFYNRLRKNGKFRFVSYHLGGESEIDLPREDVEEGLRALMVDTP